MAFRMACLRIFLNLFVDERLGNGRVHCGGIGLPDENLVIVLTVIFLVHVVGNADLRVTGRYADELRNRYRRHGRPECAEHGGVGVHALGILKSDFVAHAAHDSYTAHASVVRCLYRHGDVVGEFDLISAPGSHHAAKGGYGFDDSFAVVEDDFCLGFVDGENQNHAALAGGEVLDEREETSDEDADKCGDETFAAATPNDEEILLSSAQRWRSASGMTVENDELVSGHRKAEDGFQDDEPGSPGVELLEPRQSAEQPPVFYRVDDVDLLRHKQKSL